MDIVIDLDLLKAKDILSILSDLATFFTAIIAIIAIFQVKKQRLSSYKPDIILDSFVSKFYAENFLSKNDNFTYVTGKYLQNNQKERKEGEKYPLISYLLQNIGFGTAKYIEGFWDFDYMKASKILKKYLPEDLVLKDDNDGFYFRNEKKDFWVFFSNFSLERKQSIDFLLQEANGENGKGQTIPEIITRAYAYYVVLKHNLEVGLNKENIYEEFDEMPKPVFKVTYRDFNNKKYVKKFELNFSYIGNNFELPNQDLNYCGIFYIDVIEK
ncbi:hypothetical protein [Flavobacterium sp. HJSW_4]|uniref:hypothetical protein n=1 Tax=Flavobacterium sp. HJSW_4 TaxID=3344660 RepID=UPI0035F42312